MVGTENIKSNLINVIQGINDDHLLLKLFKQAVSYKEKDIVKNKDNKSLPYADAIVEWEDDNLTFEEVLKKQNYQPITYEKFRAKADKIEWEHSLDELNYLLDTNILLIYSRDSEVGKKLESQYKLFDKENNLAVSIVTIGELDALRSSSVKNVKNELLKCWKILLY